ncbi:MAG: rhodanese-like domain-containing protein [Pseudomonadota bacterium]
MKKTVLLLLALLAGCARAEWKEVPAAELLQRQAAGEPMLVIDVRSPEEFAAGHVPGALNLPHDRITGSEPQLKEWKQKPVVIYCRSGRRSAIAAGALEQRGFSRLEHLSGDMQGWEQQGRAVAR